VGSSSVSGQHGAVGCCTPALDSSLCVDALVGRRSHPVAWAPPCWAGARRSNALLRLTSGRRAGIPRAGGGMTPTPPVTAGAPGTRFDHPGACPSGEDSFGGPATGNLGLTDHRQRAGGEANEWRRITSSP
jgi:hypothetical protein